MKNITYCVWIFLIIIVSSCDSKKEAGGKDVVQLDPASETFPFEIQKGGDFKKVDQIRMQAKSVIQNRIKQNPEPLSMLTYGYHLPEFVFDGSKMSKPDQYLGHWIDFKEDFTYEYGYYDQVSGSGIYHFRLDDITLMTLNDDESFEPKEWKVNSNGEVLAIVGEHTFEVNNGMQIKMVPSDTKPTR